MGRKGTPFTHLQFMARSVPPPQSVIMLGKDTRPFSGTLTYNIQHTKKFIERYSRKIESEELDDSEPNLNVAFPHL